jgi:hypothetical protein
MDMMTSLLDAGVYVHAAYAAKFGVTLEDKYEPIHLIRQNWADPAAVSSPPAWNF